MIWPEYDRHLQNNENKCINMEWITTEPEYDRKAFNKIGTHNRA